MRIFSSSKSCTLAKYVQLAVSEHVLHLVTSCWCLLKNIKLFQTTLCTCSSLYKCQGSMETFFSIYFSPPFLKVKFTNMSLWCACNPNTISAVNRLPDSRTFHFFKKRKVRSSNLHILKSFMPLGDQSLSFSWYFKLTNQWQRTGTKMKDSASLDPCHFFFFFKYPSVLIMQRVAFRLILPPAKMERTHPLFEHIPLFSKGFLKQPQI